MNANGGPTLPSNMRMPLRIGAVVVAYVVYRVLEAQSQAGAVFAAIGMLMLDWTAVEFLTTTRHQRSDLMQMGSILLGLGLIGLGIFLMVR